MLMDGDFYRKIAFNTNIWLEQIPARLEHIKAKARRLVAM